MPSKNYLKYEGTYVTASEFEWEIALSLNKNGSCVINQRRWDAGSDNSSDVKKTDCSWDSDGDKISVTHGGVTDFFLYSSYLSMSELGFDGSFAAGITRVSPRNGDTLFDVGTLWKK